MAHLALPNSELHEGVRFAEQPRVVALTHEAGTAVLFPGPGAQDVAELAGKGLRNLVVIDGTWPLARKVLKENPLLQGLPRVAFTPRRPGNYRIRKEPAAHCVSTIEAVAEVLGRLEGAPERFEQMLVAFEKMVDWQLERRSGRQGPPRRKLRKPVRSPAMPARWLEAPQACVVFYAEANAYPIDSSPHFEPEVIHLVAERVMTGERFEAVLTPRSPLAPRIHEYVEVDRERLAAGEALTIARERWAAFVRPGDSLAGWGFAARQLLEREGFLLPAFEDLRLITARTLKRRAGDLERCCERAGWIPPAPWGQGRAGRRISALATVALRLLESSGANERLGHAAAAPEVEKPANHRRQPGSL
jgi:hypothetical protein